MSIEFMNMQQRAELVRTGQVAPLAWHQWFLRLSVVSFVLIGFGLMILDASSESLTATQAVRTASCTEVATDVASARHDIPSRSSTELERAYAGLPLHFEENEGQFDDAVRFVARGRNYTASLTDDEARFAICPPEEHGQTAGDIHIRFPGSHASQGLIRGEDELPGRSNYFLGDDRSRWLSNVRHYGRIVHRSLYPGIDLVHYGTTQADLEFDFIVAPGADPGQIRISYEGTGDVGVDSSGALVLETPCGPIRQHRPNVYQSISGQRHSVDGEYVKNGPREVRFRLGDYDASAPIIIDPVIAASSYLGGRSDEVVWGISVDSAGDAYVTGVTHSTDIPGSATGYQRTNAGLYDVFVTKVTAGGTRVVYTTYLGGSGNDWGLRVTPDSYGSVLVAGQTYSGDFPTRQAVQRMRRGSVDGFLTKLGPSGDTIEYSTYLGGDDRDGGGVSPESVSGLATDSTGSTYVVFNTLSPSMPHLTTSNAIASSLACSGCTDAYIVKLNASGTLIYGTYFGARGVSPNGLAVDSYGNAYITGGATTDFGFSPSGQAAMSTYRGGSSDAFVGKINAAGTVRMYATFIGGSGSEAGNAIAVDNEGHAYVTGVTSSLDFPTLGPFQANYGGGAWDAFVTKLTAAGDGFIYSTYVGGGSTDLARAIAIDGQGAVFIVGQTYSANYPSVKQFQNFAGVADAFITKLTPRGDNVKYSSFLGGESFDAANGVAFASGSVFIAGNTSSTQFPLKQPFQAVSAGAGDGFIARLAEPGMYLR